VGGCTAPDPYSWRPRRPGGETQPQDHPAGNRRRRRSPRGRRSGLQLAGGRVRPPTLRDAGFRPGSSRERTRHLLAAFAI